MLTIADCRGRMLDVPNQTQTLTGEAAALYIAAWSETERSGVPVNGAQLRRDALAASCSRKALSRLRLASARLHVRVHARPTIRRQGTCRARARSTRSRSTTTSARCKARGGKSRPGRAD